MGSAAQARVVPLHVRGHGGPHVRDLSELYREPRRIEDAVKSARKAKKRSKFGQGLHDCRTGCSADSSEAPRFCETRFSERRRAWRRRQRRYCSRESSSCSLRKGPRRRRRPCRSPESPGAATRWRDGRVVARDELLESVWGDASERAAGSFEVLVARVRRKFAAHGVRDALRTVRQVGYAWALERSKQD
jgi:hypothetical protein